MIKASFVEPIPGMPVSVYPYIAKSGSVILMVTGIGKCSDEIAGMVIGSCNSMFKVGLYDDRWNPDEFKRWDGVVTLTNLKG